MTVELWIIVWLYTSGGIALGVLDRPEEPKGTSLFKFIFWPVVVTICIILAVFDTVASHE